MGTQICLIRQTSEHKTLSNGLYTDKINPNLTKSNIMEDERPL